MFLFGRAYARDTKASGVNMSLFIAQAQDSGVTHLSGTDWVVAMALTVALVLGAGLVVILGRSVLEGRGGKAVDKTIMRSWLALSLAGGLLLFTVISFGIDDTTLRSALV